ncbi:hypothetical protein DL93DRAFT_2155799 [Clavulina sp. PMI_390]|nr:hypothetical protein DL93DRAFT_2155799 [Clavulina sp. PMI_390]
MVLISTAGGTGSKQSNVLTRFPVEIWLRIAEALDVKLAKSHRSLWIHLIKTSLSEDGLQGVPLEALLVAPMDMQYLARYASRKVRLVSHFLRGPSLTRATRHDLSLPQQMGPQMDGFEFPYLTALLPGGRWMVSLGIDSAETWVIMCWDLTVPVVQGTPSQSDPQEPVSFLPLPSEDDSAPELMFEHVSWDPVSMSYVILLRFSLRSRSILRIIFLPLRSHKPGTFELGPKLCAGAARSRPFAIRSGDYVIVDPEGGDAVTIWEWRRDIVLNPFSTLPPTPSEQETKMEGKRYHVVLDNGLFISILTKTNLPDISITISFFELDFPAESRSANLHASTTMDIHCALNDIRKDAAVNVTYGMPLVVSDGLVLAIVFEISYGWEEPRMAYVKVSYDSTAELLHFHSDPSDSSCCTDISALFWSKGRCQFPSKAVFIEDLRLSWSVDQFRDVNDAALWMGVEKANERFVVVGAPNECVYFAFAETDMQKRDWIPPPKKDIVKKTMYLPVVLLNYE